MPTSKIENREEAAKAFMEGAYFKVGDRFISPDEIVTARRDGSGNPVFELTTGETVSHERFQRGSVGHFLFEQLRKVEGRYVEQIKPEYNLAGYGKNLFDGGGQIIATINWQDDNPAIHRIDVQNGVIWGSGANGSGGGSADILKADIEGNVLDEQDVVTKNNASSQAIDYDPDAKEIYVNYARTEDDAGVEKINYDLTGQTNVISGLGNGISGPSINHGATIAVLPSKGVGITTLLEGTSQLFQLDGSGSQNTGVDLRFVAPDRENGDFVGTKDFAVSSYFRLDATGQKTKEVSLQSKDLNSVAAVPGARGVVGWYRSNNEIIQVSPDGSVEVIDENVPEPFRNSALDVALDLSRL